MKRKFLVLILSTMLALSSTACSGDSANASASVKTDDSASIRTDTQTENKVDTQTETESKADTQTETEAQSEADPMEAAMKNMESVTSMEAQMIMDMDMTVSADGQEQTLETSTVMDMVCFNDPLKIKVDMTMDMGAQGSLDMKIYAEPAEDGTYIVYMYDGQNWSSNTTAVSALEEYDARSSMVNYIGDGSLYKQEGTEQVNGANAYKYSYVLTEAEMKEAMLSSGALDSVSSLGLDASQVDGMLDGLGEVVTYVWIDEETLYPVKYEMDMTKVMDTLMVNMIEALGDQAEGISMNVPELKITMTCSNFNNATDFTVPDEAKN